MLVEGLETQGWRIGAKGAGEAQTWSNGRWVWPEELTGSQSVAPPAPAAPSNQPMSGRFDAMGPNDGPQQPQQNVYQDEAGVYRNRYQANGEPAFGTTGPLGAQPGGYVPSAQPGYSGGAVDFGSGWSSGASGGMGPNAGPRAATNYGFSSGMSGEAWGDNVQVGAGGAPGAPGPGGGRAPAVQSRGGGSSGGASGGSMAGPQNLDPALMAQATGQAGVLSGLSGQVGGVAAPSTGMERTLYDRYAQHLMDPAAFAQNPAYQAALAQAQQASGRQLAAGRMSKSGNAAIQAAQVAGQTFMNQYKDIGQLYGQGADAERARYATGVQGQSTQYNDLLNRYKTQGALAVQSGGLSSELAGMTGGMAPAAGGWQNPYAMYPGDYRAGMTQEQVAAAMQPRFPTYGV